MVTFDADVFRLSYLSVVSAEGELSLWIDYDIMSIKGGTTSQHKQGHLSYNLKEYSKTSADALPRGVSVYEEPCDAYKHHLTFDWSWNVLIPFSGLLSSEVLSGALVWGSPESNWSSTHQAWNMTHSTLASEHTGN